MSSSQESAGGRTATDSAGQSENLAESQHRPPEGCFGLGNVLLHVNPKASDDDRNFSALCLVGCGVAVLDEIAEGLNSETLYGALYLLRQANLFLRVNPEASEDDRNFSPLCLVGCGVAILDEIAEELNSEALYGALYLLRQAKLVLNTSTGGAA